ncbi:MAG: PhoU domain-containing protein [Nanobdellota archaeon]
MDIRNVQKTGSMLYVYLPTNWCKQFGINSGSKVKTSQSNDGSLVVSPDIKEKELKQIELDISSKDQKNINKLIVACYVNPLKSFSINLEKELDISRLLLQKKLLSVELVEFDGKHIMCESSFTVDDPFSLLKTMIKKIKNLLYVMMKNYNRELIERYEEEIDRSHMHISKSVIGMLTHNKSSKYKIIEVHYIGFISKDLERLVDHLKEIPSSEEKYMDKTEKVIGHLDSLFGKKFDYDDVLEYTKKVNDVPYQEVKGSDSYHKVRVKAALESMSEVLMNWSISKKI